MKVLLAEYATACDPALAPEGAAMLDVLAGSFARCGYDVVQPGPGDFSAEIVRLAPECDIGLVIAPDHMLAKLTLPIEQYSHNLGCGSMNAALCASKVATGRVLRGHGIPVPAPAPSGRRVVKPINGCDSHGVRLTTDAPGPGEFAEAYIEGEHYSVSLLLSRVVGEACLYFSGNAPLVLSVNKQDVTLDPDGRFTYGGGETPVHPPREQEIRDTAIKAATVLGCQGYCGVDVVVGDQVCVVDVNPRITTSIVGIAACMEEEIANLLVAASRGSVPKEVHLSGHVRFDRAGKVTRL
ncbi:ATP-grasp domain-containing protein [Methanoregula sp.]|uniref:ATP-grasp domain-containing protein n=1 Tax=Methanoregula sp. TaxID=2052170 RepID=UPI002C96C5F8|nr:ATP-grasp domain-containing protein [Methanoregula sp.]HVP97447.1 ATP-grasp domain-containing protein [Methanoregula sp.]